MTIHRSPVFSRHVDGTITVEHAGPAIEVGIDALATLDLARSTWLDGDTLMIKLDTAGEYIYRFVRFFVKHGRVMLIFRREPETP